MISIGNNNGNCVLRYIDCDLNTSSAKQLHTYIHKHTIQLHEWLKFDNCQKFFLFTNEFQFSTLNRSGWKRIHWIYIKCCTKEESERNVPFFTLDGRITTIPRMHSNKLNRCTIWDFKRMHSRTVRSNGLTKIFVFLFHNECYTMINSRKNEQYPNWMINDSS